MVTPTQRSTGGISRETIAYWVGGILAVGLALYAVYIGMAGAIIAQRQRSLLLLLAVPLSFLLYRGTKKADKSLVPWYDWLLMILSVFSIGYMVVFAMELQTRYAFITKLTPFQIGIGIMAVFLMVEAGRRVLGNAMCVILMVALMYAYYGAWIPGRFGHRYFSIGFLTDHFYFTEAGIFSVPVGIVSTYVALFVVFGVFLERAGGGRFFIDLVSSMLGHVRGGPAKAATVGSGLMGSLTGSVAANVVTTGSFSIPLMKRVGYTAEFAGAVEAVASTGGQLMPPVMGTTAFLVAEFAGVPYRTVALTALIPAFLYYLSLIWMIDLEARRTGLKGLPRHMLPQTVQVLREGWVYLIPFGMVFYMIITGFSPLRAAYYGFWSVLAIIYLRRSTWLSFSELWSAFAAAGRAILVPAVATGAAGIIIGTFTLSGLGLQMNSMIVTLAAGSLMIGLVLAMLANIILGMGMPAPVAYLIQVSFTIPALIAMGAPVLPAHLFVLFFSSLSFVTPPVAIGAYTAAAIAGSDPMRTGYVAWRLALAAFLIPFAFVYAPGLIGMGTVTEVLHALLSASIGILALGGAVVGQFYTACRHYERVLLFAAATLTITGGALTDALGLTLLATVMILQYVRGSKIRRPSQVDVGTNVSQ